jgi:peptidyl-prolyl cis-trans isomerase-like 4
VRPELKHTKAGLVCMASAGENMNTSQFYITMRGEDLEVRKERCGRIDRLVDRGWFLTHPFTTPPPHHQFLDGKHTIFGEVAEGLDTVLKEMNELYCDTNGRPYRCVSLPDGWRCARAGRQSHTIDSPTKPITITIVRDVRILHTYVLEDPFDDPPGLAEFIPDASPERDRPPEEAVKPRLTDLVDEEDGLTAEALEERIKEADAKKRAVVLEMIGCVN